MALLSFERSHGCSSTPSLHVAGVMRCDQICQEEGEADGQSRKSRLAVGDAAAHVEKPPCDAFKCVRKTDFEVALNLPAFEVQ